MDLILSGISSMARYKSVLEASGPREFMDSTNLYCSALVTKVLAIVMSGKNIFCKLGVKLMLPSLILSKAILSLVLTGTPS